MKWTFHDKFTPVSEYYHNQHSIPRGIGSVGKHKSKVRGIGEVKWVYYTNIRCMTSELQNGSESVNQRSILSFAMPNHTNANKQCSSYNHIISEPII